MSSSEPAPDLRGFTIGAGSRIGAGSVVVREVPPNSVVVGVPGRITSRDGQRVNGEIDLNQVDLPDPSRGRSSSSVDRIRFLEAEVDQLRRHTEAPASVHPD